MMFHVKRYLLFEVYGSVLVAAFAGGDSADGIILDVGGVDLESTFQSTFVVSLYILSWQARVKVMLSRRFWAQWYLVILIAQCSLLTALSGFLRGRGRRFHNTRRR